VTEPGQAGLRFHDLRHTAGTFYKPLSTSNISVAALVRSIDETTRRR
jgi:hypothetical protein